MGTGISLWTHQPSSCTHRWRWQLLTLFMGRLRAPKGVRVSARAVTRLTCFLTHPPALQHTSKVQGVFMSKLGCHSHTGSHSIKWKYAQVTARRGKSGRESDLPPPGVSKKNILGKVTLLETWPQTLPWAMLNVILRTVN